MANLSVEEPYALMRARTGLREPWAGNCPGPPGLSMGSGVAGGRGQGARFRGDAFPRPLSVTRTKSSKSARS